MHTRRKALVIALAALILISATASVAFAANFTDTKGHWSEEYVDKANNNGLVNGVGGGKYIPDASVSAAEWVTMVINLFYEAERDVNRDKYEQEIANIG